MIALALALSGVSADYVYASTVKTEQLAATCAGTAGRPLEQNFCTGYVLATYDALSASKAICPGPGASTLQVMAVVRKYLAEHPEEWDKFASDVVGTPLKATFVCPWNMNWGKPRKGR